MTHRSMLVAATVGALIAVGGEVWVRRQGSGTGACGADSAGVCFPVMEPDQPWWTFVVAVVVGAVAGALSWWALARLTRAVRDQDASRR